MTGLVPGYLRCEYRLDPPGIDVAAPRLSWIVESEQRGQRQTAYQILVADDAAALEAERGTLWDSGKVESDRTAQVVYGGAELASHMRCFWKVRVWDRDGAPSAWSEVACWSMGLLAPEQWRAQWIGHDAPYRDVPRQGHSLNPEYRKPLLVRLIPRPVRRLLKFFLGEFLMRMSGRIWLWRTRRIELLLPPCPHLRREFHCAKPRRATLYASALGLYEIHLNGHRVGDGYFTPGWTDYRRRVYYQTYDVTALLREGANALGAILSDGWYAGYVGPWRKRNHYGAAPRLALELHIEDEDGGDQVVVTDAAWTATTGAILEADLLMGESFDARLEPAGWAEAGYDDGAWVQVDVGERVDARMQAMPHEPVRRTGELEAVEVTEPRPGCHVFDMGRNVAGWARLRARGPAGTEIVLRFGERLNPDGTLYTANLRGARATDTYVMRGEGEEIWEPRFTYHGFQYVEVTGYPGVPRRDAVTGIVVNSDMPFVGSFACSNPLVNALYDNIVWTQRANFVDIPTDCPQRDERLGWLGDAQIFLRTATYNMDVAAFFTKWLADVRDAQSEAGAFPDLAPRVSLSHDGSPAWADAGLICPWVLYRVYGDTRLIERHYDAMTKWVAFVREGNPDLLWKARAGNNNGEWLPIDGGTPKEVLATAYFAYSTRLLGRMAAAIGRHEDAEAYEALFEEIRRAFNAAYVAADGRVAGGTQTCYVLALHFDLLPGELRDKAARLLVDDIARRGGHLSTGFFGTGYLAPELTANGYAEVAHRLVAKDTYPSWGYTIRQGATSIWERWDGWTEDKGFQDPIMNSFSHYGFGSIGEWLFAAVAGIDAAAPGFRRIIIHPRPGGGLSHAEAHYQSINGRIEASWRLEQGRFVLDLAIPANTSATVVLPARGAEDVSESGRPLSEVEAVELARVDDGEVVLEVGSGRYAFAAGI